MGGRRLLCPAAFRYSFFLLQQDKQINSTSPTKTSFYLIWGVFVCFPRELCEDSMTPSVSSASSLDSHAPSEYGGARWEEQQKALALEQLCGVFRVDLGHMRSLRLFFRWAGGRAPAHRAAALVLNEAP